MGEKHSAVGYLFREGAFLPAQETKPVRNEFGLDLFQHRGSVYEGKTGLQFCSLQQAEDLAGFVEKHGGIIIGLAYNPVLYERVTAACKNRAAPGAAMTGKGHNGTPVQPQPCLRSE